MKSSVIAACLVLSCLARAENVMVETLKPLESSRHTRILVVLGGMPQEGATVDFYPIAALPHFSAITDKKGVATPPELAVGDYNVVAKLDEDVSASLSLHVVAKKDVSTFSIDLTGPLAQAQRAEVVAESLPIRHRVPAFRGTIIDPTGAVIPGAIIRVVMKGPQKKGVALRVRADAQGHFSGQLDEGSYIAFVFSQGFRTAVVPFELTREGRGDLSIMLQVGSS